VARNPMAEVYKRLSGLGLPKTYVRATVLPSWWDDDAATSPAGLAEAKMLIARHVGIDLADLKGTETPKPGMITKYKFKKAKKSSGDDVDLARRLASQVAFLAAHAVAAPIVKLPTAAEIRARLIDEGNPWIGLECLLDFCWTSGIPVLHVNNFPPGAKKMDGLSANVGGRPVIIISKEHRQPAWLLFILAHELGHIERGHIEEDEVLVDERVEVDSSDSEEIQANEFALELLCGDKKKTFVAADRWPNANQLAAEARRIGTKLQIDPGHIVLNYGNSMGRTFFPVANAALAMLNPSPDAVGLIQGRLAKNLDWSSLPEEAAEFVAKMTVRVEAPALSA
jgi:hypothetical protein